MNAILEAELQRLAKASNDVVSAVRTRAGWDLYYGTHPHAVYVMAPNGTYHTTLRGAQAA